ncbi:50S ribosomal protein L21 [Patescibacteria group bacterium]|nr:50S ribosomal protein L21 [Patescibacteria group bacterium]MBU2633113.1 50S ribosomal protein L21 [Patescibacteria group bacterium]
MVEDKKIKKETPVNFAVIETGGKQHLVQPGDKIRVEKLEKPQKGDVLVFESVLLVSKKGKLEIGNPYVKGAKIKGKWLAEIRDKKIKNVRYKSKTRQYRRQGHRQIHTQVLIGDF